MKAAFRHQTELFPKKFIATLSLSFVPWWYNPVLLFKYRLFWNVLLFIRVTDCQRSLHSLTVFPWISFSPSIHNPIFSRCLKSSLSNTPSVSISFLVKLSSNFIFVCLPVCFFSTFSCRFLCSSLAVILSKDPHPMTMWGQDQDAAHWSTSVCYLLNKVYMA